MIYSLYILFITIFVLLDQFAKKAVIANIKLNQVIVVIKGFFNLTNVRNYGAGFSILQHATTFLLTLTIISCIVLFYLLVTCDKRDLLSIICYLLIISGAIGNFIDRVKYSYVIDFLDFRIFGYDFPVFNVADSFITVGCFLLILKLFMENRHAKS